MFYIQLRAMFFKMIRLILTHRPMCKLGSLHIYFKNNKATHAISRQKLFLIENVLFDTQRKATWGYNNRMTSFIYMRL